MGHRSILKVFVLLIVCSSMVTSQSKELFIDEERPIIKVDGHEEYSQESLEEAFEHAPCHMEYQVMKRVIGTCVKLGKTARGCVAGHYLHPLHPECM